MKTKLFITGLAFMALTAMASAQSADQTPAKSQAAAEKMGTFVDANNNGICDNMKNGLNAANCKGSGAATCCGQGKKQMMGQGQGQGQGKEMGAKSEMGQKKMGMGQGKSMCKNFVDADNNGICDKFEAAAKK